MFLLIRNSGRCRRGYARNLHSTMFLLIQMEPWRLTYRECNLHSTMFLLILVLIPCLISLFVFTFHNVSINSMVCLIEIAAERRFTFHNVSINSRPPTTIISSIVFLLFLSTSFYSPHLISIFLL